MMRFFRALLLVLLALAVVATALYFTGNYELTDRLTELFWAVQLWVPVTFGFEQFLVILAAISVVAVVLVISGSAAVLVMMANRRSRSAQRREDRVAAAQQEIAHVKEQYQRQYEELELLGQRLTRQLDKRLLLHALVEAASRVTSGTQANSIVGLWLLHPETDTLRFETGLYCDETLFTKTEFLPTEQPFARVISTQKPWVLQAWEAEAPLVKSEKAAQLGSATGLILVPFLMEGRVSAILALFCPQDVLKSYEEQKAFYNAIWTELMLASVIAIQGAVTILDRLTGVHTRDYFTTRLLQELERANRYQLPLSLLMIDIDNFKLVNDMLGHPQGDAVLKIIAKLIRKEVRAIDLVGRYGGEEFVVMLPETGYGEDIATNTGALVVAERIRKAVDDEFHGLQKPLNLTISIGVMVRRFPQDREMGHQELVRLADEQLYRAKTTGKNKVCSLLQQQSEGVGG